MTRRLTWLLLLVALEARAQEQEQAQAQDPSTLYSRAEAAERAHELDEALASYRALIEAAPAHRLASRARRRVQWIEARSEGGLDDLEATMRVRDRGAGSTAEIAAFEARALAFESGLLRREALALIGEAWLEAGDARGAERAFRNLLSQEDLTGGERVLARTGIARALAMREGAAAGAHFLEQEGLHETPTHTSLAREARAAPLRIAAIIAIAVFIVMALGLSGRELTSRAVWRRALSPARVLAGLYAAAGPALIAWRYDAEALDTLAWLGAGTLVLAALASLAGAATSGRSRGARAGLAALAVLAHAGAGWLALELGGARLSILP